MSSFREDLQKMYKRAGVKGEGLMFLITDSQVGGVGGGLLLAWLPALPVVCSAACQASCSPDVMTRLVMAACHQIVDERMLVYINDLLASGEIPDLFAQVRWQLAA
jgi:dynein heavy chain